MSCRSLRLRSFAFVLPAVRVFISCLVFLSACLVGSRCLLSGPVLASPRVPHPVRFLLRPCFRPPLISSILFGRLIRSCLPARPRLGDSVGRVIPSVSAPCFSPSASVFRLLPPLCPVLSAWLVSFRPVLSRSRGVPRAVLPSFRPSPRIACRRGGAARCAVVPYRLVWLVAWGPVPRGCSFLGGLSSRPVSASRRPCLLPLSRYRAGWRRLSMIGASRCPCVPLRGCLPAPPR